MRKRALWITGAVLAALLLFQAAVCAAEITDSLAVAAQDYYESTYGFRPPLADCVQNEDGTYTIHLYEIVDNGDGTYHTATSAWYTVDQKGEGNNLITEEPISLNVQETPGQGTDLVAAGSGDFYPEDVIALDDLGFSVEAADYTAIRQNEGFVYIYTGEDGYIPYVIIGKYEDTSDSFADSFTRYMSENYSDLDVDELQEGMKIGDKTFTRVVYRYSVGDYEICDTRLFCTQDSRTYMFGSKEVPELGDVMKEGYLDDIAGSFAFLAGGDDSYSHHVDAERSVSAAMPEAEGGAVA